MGKRVLFYFSITPQYLTGLLDIVLLGIVIMKAFTALILFVTFSAVLGRTLTVRGRNSLDRQHADINKVTNCSPGEHFKLNCNSCVCGPDGVAACTMKMCMPFKGW